MNKLPQKLIFLAGETRTVKLSIEAAHVAVISCPDNLVLVRPPAPVSDGWNLEFRATERRANEYGRIEVRVTASNGEFTAQILSRVLGRKEFFFCVVTTCNTHWGFDPSRVCLCDVDGVEDFSACSGDPLVFHGHAFSSSRYMATAAHQFNLPMTWLIDHTVAKDHGKELKRFHDQFGDDAGVLPSSYFFDNPVNYNLDRSLEDAVGVLQGTIAGIQRELGDSGWVPDIKVGGIDQWVGGLGNRWIEAARRVGLRGLWGTAFDHVTCDTSMFHEGLPWDVYRMSKENFRYPSGNASDPWGFPWTTRDLVNSFHEYPGSSVFYSTDPDDIRGCGIMNNQPDYWDLLLAGLLENFEHNQSTCFVIHNEDHDAHRVWSQNYLLQFFSRLPSGIVKATLDEVTQWLDLCYLDGQHPRQALELQDPLRCHDAVFKARAPRGFVPHSKWKTKGGVNPGVVVFYDASSRWMASEGAHLPEQLIDYSLRVEFQETGVSPKVELPRISSWKELVSKTDTGLHIEVTFESDRAMKNLPLIFWGAVAPRGSQRMKNASVIWTDVNEGCNKFLWEACNS